MVYIFDLLSKWWPHLPLRIYTHILLTVNTMENHWTFVQIAVYVQSMPFSELFLNCFSLELNWSIPRDTGAVHTVISKRDWSVRESVCVYWREVERMYHTFSTLKYKLFRRFRGALHPDWHKQDWGRSYCVSVWHWSLDLRACLSHEEELPSFLPCSSVNVITNQNMQITCNHVISVKILK